MKKLLLLSFMFLFVVGYAVAQRTVTGTITDAEGLPLIGANVLAKGTTIGTITDIDGRYTLDVPDDTQMLSVSYTGYTSKEIELGSSNVVDLILTEGLELDEIVVTGLGIKKEKKALGYGVTTLDNKDIAARQETDVARILRGKATGVDISSTSGLAGSGTNIIIRGYSTITGSNQPLFVVDGVPFNTDANSGNQDFNSGSASASSRFLDLDPNTIEEISILKGLSATVLYGEAGRNGVVLVTTKNGSGGANATKGMEVTVNQGLFQSEIANLPDYQNTYGNGFNAGFGWFFSNWGAAFDDLRPSSYGSDYQGEQNGQVLITHPYDQAQYADDFPEFAGADYLYQPYESVENFFEPGVSSNTSVSIQTRLNDNSSLSASYSFLTEEGFTPNKDERNDNARSNYLDKHNFGLGAQTTLGMGLKVKGSFNYVATDRETPLTGSGFGGDGNGLFGALLFTPRSVDLMNLPYQSPIDGSNVYYRRGSPIQNPRWTLNNTGQTEDINRFFSTTELSYEFTDNISVLYRLGLDNYSQDNQRFINRGGARAPDGELWSFDIANKITDQLVNVLYNYQLTEDWSIDGVVGANSRREYNEETGTISSNQFVYGLLRHSNFIDHNSYNFNTEENTLGVYGTATLGYRSFLYLNLQARNDWTSTLEPDNRSVFYPSASLSFIPTDAFESLQNNSIMNYLKLRLGYGTSAGYPPPYSTRNTLDTRPNAFVTAGGAILNTNGVSRILGNRNLRNELFKELEGGVEARFFNNRVGVDLSIFNKVSSDLIIDLPLDPATGYDETTQNAAEVENNGIELGLNFTPVISDNFQWDFTVNYTQIRSNVNEIIDGIDQVFIAGNPFGGDFPLGNYAIPGEQFGVIFGQQFEKDDQGRILVDGQGGYVRGGYGIIGDPNPEFNLNWINNIGYRGLSLGFQWQYVHGGQLYSSTVGALLARGNTVDSDFDRSVPLVLPNGVNSDGTPNDKQVYVGDEAFATFFTDEGAILDGTLLRLRQISLAYAVPQKLVDKTPFGRLGLTLSGENLWLKTPNIPAGMNFDPEVNSSGVGNGRGLDFRTAPTARKIGITLNASF